MSMLARQRLVDSPKTIFQRDSQRSDLLNPDLTSTYLIEVLTEIVIVRGWALEFTAIRSDHHDDSGLALGPEHVGTHAFGWAADCWPLSTATAGDYIDATDPLFQRFLHDLSGAQGLLQIGLGGSAYTPANIAAATPCFQDVGADHIHVGATPY